MDELSRDTNVSGDTLSSPSLVGSKPTGNALASLYPALVQCFTIILFGYVTGRGGWITTSHSKGLSTFTGKFALPALLFKSMATLDWSMVEWKFLGAMFISKAGLYAIAFISTLFLKRPRNIGLAALAGIFVTQSNDFALGYPIVKAIYSETQPQFIQYLYLIAPISLIILNPIGFVLLELHKASSQSVRRSKAALMLRVLTEIITNPIIVMTVLGVIANFIFSHKLPDILDSLLSTLGEAFSACALFLLGLSIVGKFNKTMRPLLLTSGLLIFAKLLLLPMIAMGVTKALNCGDSTNSSTEYSMFAFLYGTFPTAPTVYLYSTQYGVGTDLVATSLVLGTVISAPLMFTSAMVVGMQFFTTNLQSILADTSFDVAILSIVCSVAVVLLFISTRRASRMPHIMVLIIAVFQLLLALDPVFTRARTQDSGSLLTWVDYVIFGTHSIGIIGVSTMSSVTAITIYCISCHSTCLALTWRPRLLCYGVGAPVLLAAAVVPLTRVQAANPQGFIAFSDVQMGVICGVLIANIILTIVILVLRHRRSHRRSLSGEGEGDSSQAISSYNNELCRSDEKSSIVSSTNSPKAYGTCSNSCSEKGGCSSTEDEAKSLLNIEDLVPFPSSPSTSIQDERMCSPTEKCSEERVRRCSNLLEKYDRVNEGNVNIYDYQLGRMLVLLTLLLVCQTMVAFCYVWQLVIPAGTSQTSLFAELRFIYIVLCTGQGFFTFLTFGLDSEVVLMPAKRLFLRIVNKIRGKQGVSASLSDESRHICLQFSEHHLAHCKQSLDRLHSSKQDCFSGAVLVSWLIDAGLVVDSAEGVMYAESLLQGDVIRACSKRSLAFFDTKRHIYRFGSTFAK